MQPPQHVCPPKRRKFVLICAILASAMGFIDFSVIAVALPQIRAGFDASFSQAQWFSNAYMLFLSALILVGGALGDRFGLKFIFLLGIALFTLASVACALAWNSESLITFRALQGVGAAIMIPGSMAIIAKNTPRAERGKALGIWVAASSITTSMGPFLGGVLLTYGGEESWRWIFAINLPFGLLAMALLVGLVPSDEPTHAGGLASIDWIGAFLLTASLGMVAAGLTYLGELEGGTGAAALLGAGLAVGIAAIFWELRHSDPMVSMQLFSSVTFAGGNLLTFLVWAGMGAMVFFLPMLVIVAWKLPATYAGGMFVPFSLMIALLSSLSGRWADRLGTRFFLTAGPLVASLAFLALAWAVIRQDYWFGLLPGTCLVGVGVGLTASPLSTAVMNAVDDKFSGAASGINNMVARMSNMFGVAGLGALVAHAYATVVGGSDLNAQIKLQMMEAGFGERLTGPLYQTATENLQLLAMNYAAFVLCLVMALMALAATLVGWRTQDGPV